MFGLGIFDYIKIGAGAALGALVAAGPVYLYGKHEGKQAAAVAALETSVKVLRKRNDINDEISSSAAAALCAGNGLSVDDEKECVRRLERASSEAGDDRVHYSE
jgi:hypothetical protein